MLKDLWIHITDCKYRWTPTQLGKRQLDIWVFILIFPIFSCYFYRGAIVSEKRNLSYF